MNSEQTQSAIEGAALQTTKIAAGINSTLQNLRGTIAQNNAIPSDIETYLSGIEAEAVQLAGTGSDLNKLASALAPTPAPALEVASIEANKTDAASDEEPQVQAASIEAAPSEEPERPTGAEEDTTTSARRRK